MMKCKHCNGFGWYYNDITKTKKIKCECCGGTGEVEQTNEEYFKSCNTEQLAEKLWELYNAGKDDAKTYDTFEYFIDKEDVLEWLKQPHMHLKNDEK